MEITSMPPATRRSKLGVWLFTIAVLIALAYGWDQRHEYWLNPEYGLGYWLGIIGGSMMLILLLYPLRKKWKRMRGVIAIRYWFQWHMILGVVGPVLILFHCNFQLGATNSNVALISMILVVLSGLIGRYVYRQFHDGLYGNEMSYKDMRQNYDKQKEMILKSPFLSADIKKRLLMLEELANSIDGSVFGQWRTAKRVKFASEKVMKHLKREIQVAMAGGADGRKVRQLRILENHLNIELDYLRKMTRYSLYSHLFSIWHILHFPLFLMLIIAATVHIVAVHMY